MNEYGKGEKGGREGRREGGRKGGRKRSKFVRIMLLRGEVCELSINRLAAYLPLHSPNRSPFKNSILFSIFISCYSTNEFFSIILQNYLKYSIFIVSSFYTFFIMNKIIVFIKCSVQVPCFL